MLARPIFPCSHPQSIVGTNELNFCVRNGNRWTLVVIITNCYMRHPLRAVNGLLYLTTSFGTDFSW